MRRPLLLFGLIWASFLVIFPFAAMGDTSALHIACHLLQLPLLGAAVLLAWRIRREASSRAERVLGWALSVTIPIAMVCTSLELAVAVARLAQDGWVNKDTADVWEQGPHYVIASVTVPAVMLSMLGALALVATAGVKSRRRLEAAQ